MHQVATKDLVPTSPPCLVVVHQGATMGPGRVPWTALFLGGTRGSVCTGKGRVVAALMGVLVARIGVAAAA